MPEIIHLLESIVHYAAELVIIVAELAGIAVLVITAVASFIKYFRKDERLRLYLAHGIALALEFMLGGEVLRTVIVREWKELLVLAAVIVMRVVLTLLLHWEIKIEEEHEHLEMLDQHNDLMAIRIAEEKKNLAESEEDD